MHHLSRYRADNICVLFKDCGERDENICRGKSFVVPYMPRNVVRRKPLLNVENAILVDVVDSRRQSVLIIAPSVFHFRLVFSRRLCVRKVVVYRYIASVPCKGVPVERIEFSAPLVPKECACVHCQNNVGEKITEFFRVDNRISLCVHLRRKSAGMRYRNRLDGI